MDGKKLNLKNGKSQDLHLTSSDLQFFPCEEKCVYVHGFPTNNPCTYMGFWVQKTGASTQSFLKKSPSKCVQMRAFICKYSICSK